MTKQEFLERFNKKTLQPLSRGFCEIDEKKYYCLTNDGSYRHTFVNCDSFTYFVFLKAFYEMAKSIGEECVDPELVNVGSENGFIKGDILLEDFSRGDKKVKVYSEKGDNFSEDDLIGNMLYKENMSLKEQMEQFKYLSEYYNNPQIYQCFLKHYLFHYYLGDEDFHFENIEVFIDENGKSRVSPLYDFSGVFYLSTDEYGNGSWGFNYNQIHIAPNFLKYEMLQYLKSEYPDEFENYSIDDIQNEFYIKPKTVAKHVRTRFLLNNQKSILNKAVADLEDKSYIDRLLSVDVGSCLTDDIYTKELKDLLNMGVSFGRKNIEKAYRSYKLKQNKQLE